MRATEQAVLEGLLREVGASEAEPPSPAVWRALLELISRGFGKVEREKIALEQAVEAALRETQVLYEAVERRSELRLAAERARTSEGAAMLRATLEAASEGILVVDRERKVIAANRRFSELLGVPRALLDSRDHAAIVDQSIRSLGLPASAQGLIEAIHASTDVFRDELVAADGRVLERFSAPVELDGGAVGRVTFFRDVTSERQARRDIEAARAVAEAASQAKSVFLASMSHELRTPLNAVIGLSDLLTLGGALSERQREYVDGIAESGRYLLALVNDVLDLAKIEAGAHTLEPEEMELADVLEDGMSALVPLAHHRGVTLESEAAAGIIRADRLRLRQILYNLLSSAVRDTDRGGGVRARARREPSVVAIEIAGGGMGTTHGPGLALVLTRRLIEMHDGTLEVTAAPGRGTTFTVRIPDTGTR